ncbi:MAG: M20/M25/M40 family metallo-hydrolase [Tissierellaceae bacterium]
MNDMDLLKRLIEMDTSELETANEAVEFLSSYLKDRGIEGKVIEFNGYKSYVASFGEGDRTIVLNGHLDVVPGDKSQFVPVEKNGRIYGRGSADMKAGCLAMINAAVELAKEPIGCKLMLQLVTDEENGGFNGTKNLVDLGYLGDFVICTEPTNLNIGVQSKGFMRVDIEFEGKAAHGSRPWEGHNAIEKAFGEYEKILKIPMLNEGSQYYESSTVNLALIEGGDAYNKVPDKSLIGLDIRYVPSINPYKLIEELGKAVDGKVEMKLLGHAVNSSPEDSYIRWFVDTINSFGFPEQVSLYGQHGSSDGRFFASKGIPVIEYGPKGDNWHGSEEYVEIESIFDLEEILKAFIRRF